MDKHALLRAINFLISREDAPVMYQSVLTASRVPLDLMVGLVGDADVLTPLVEVRRADADRFDSLMELVNKKRAEVGAEPLGTPDKGFDKVEYQRSFMDQKRQRERRAVDLENAVRSERDKLIGNHRLEFMREQSKRWKTRRDEMMTAAREAAGGTLTKEQQTRVLKSFWESVDAELDELEVSVRRRGLGL